MYFSSAIVHRYFVILRVNICCCLRRYFFFCLSRPRKIFLRVVADTPGILALFATVSLTLFVENQRIIIFACATSVFNMFSTATDASLKIQSFDGTNLAQYPDWEFSVQMILVGKNGPKMAEVFDLSVHHSKLDEDMSRLAYATMVINARGIALQVLRHVASFNGRAALEAMRREFGQRDVAYVVTQIRAVVHTAWTGNFLQFKHAILNALRM